MSTELIRDVNRLEAKFDGLKKPEIQNNVLALYQQIPGLVGFWSMSSVQRSTGNAYDLSGQGRTLTYNGNPTYNIYNNIVPYIDFDGTGDYLSRADETDLDITGGETIYNSSVRGLTFGGWFWPNNLNLAGLVAKSSGATVAYRMFIRNTPQFEATISSTGVFPATDVVISSVTPAVNQWYFCVTRFVPSTSLDIFINNIKTSLATATSAAANTGDALNIGATAGANVFNGRASLCFLSANALPDTFINLLFQQSRILFGV